MRHALVFLIHTLGQPEVGDLDASPGTEDDVFGLDVAVDDRLSYRIAQSLCNGLDNLQSIIQRNLPFPLHPFEDCLTFDKLHGKEMA